MRELERCKDLGIETILARYFNSKNSKGLKLDDLLLHTFFECNMHTRSSIIWLACAWDELYFGDIEKSKYYMDKFVGEGEEIDREMEEWLREKRAEIEEIRKNR